MLSALTRKMGRLATTAVALAVGFLVLFTLATMREQWARHDTLAHDTISNPNTPEHASVELLNVGHDGLNHSDSPHLLPTSTDFPPATASSVDGVVVMGRLDKENTSWVTNELPNWEHAIYVVDNDTAPLHTPINKGKEAMSYLTYVIEHYTNLPRTIVFLHAHRDGWPGGWHTDAPDYSNVYTVKHLNIDFVQSNGYANLRCIWTPGCPDEVRPFRDPVDESRTIETNMPAVWADLFGNNNVPEVIATPCCAQFAVSRDQVQKRPLKDYLHFRQWLFDTPMEDDLSGRIFEYLWHIIFGQDPVFCPSLDQCYRDVYSRGGSKRHLSG